MGEYEDFWHLLVKPRCAKSQPPLAFQERSKKNVILAAVLVCIFPLVLAQLQFGDTSFAIFSPRRNALKMLPDMDERLFHAVLVDAADQAPHWGCGPPNVWVLPLNLPLTFPPVGFQPH